MSSTYTKHYQDSVDRKTENNDVIRRLLIVDNNLANISQGVNALGTSNATANAIFPIYADTQNIRNNQLPNLGSSIAAVNNQVAQLIGGQNNQATFNQVNAIVQQIPTLATSNQVNQQAIVIGGVRTDVANLQSSVNAVRTESANIPRNIYNAQLSSIKNDINTIPTNVYNAQLTALQSSVNNIPTYNGSNAIAALDVQVGLIPRTNYSSNFLTVGNQLTRIENTANAIPTYNASSGVAQLIGGQSNQAIVIGGISSDTQTIKNNDIPRLATGNQVNALSSSIASGRNESNAIPRNTYNAQLDTIQATENATRTESQNIPRNIYNTQIANAASQSAIANASVQTVRTEQSSRFNNVDSGISGLSGQISGLTSSNGTASSVVNLNATALIVPYSVNNFARDLIYALGAIEGGYSGVAPSVVEVTANFTDAGDSNQLLNKNSSGWYSSNVAGGYFTLDFGKNKTTRTIVITGLGFQGSQSGAIGSPINLIISGSNNGTSFTTIQTWSGLGITASYQWKFLIFSNSIAYRYIRIAQSGLNNANTNYFACASLNFYGTINNP